MSSLYTPISKTGEFFLHIDYTKTQYVKTYIKYYINSHSIWGD